MRGVSSDAASDGLPERKIRAASNGRRWNKILPLLLPLSVYALGVLFFAQQSSYAIRDFPLDDAWIHRIYSQAFAEGRGFQYNRGGPQEAGSTSPLWAIATVPAHWIEPLAADALVITVKAIAFLLGCAALLAVVSLGAQASGSRAAGLIAATLFAADPVLLFATFSGMESILLIALWLAGVATFAARRWSWSLLCFAMAPLARPEAAILLPMWLVAAWLVEEGRHPTREDHARWLLAWTPVALWMAFCHAANGHWLPTTFYLKASAFRFGIEPLQAVALIVTQHGYAHLGIFGLVLVLLLGWCIARRDRSRLALAWFLIVAPTLYAIAIGGSRRLNPNGYYWTRWVEPASLVLTAAFCLGCGLTIVAAIQAGSALLASPRRRASATDLCSFAVGVALMWAIVLAGPDLADSVLERARRLSSDARAIHLINVAPGEWIRDHTRPDALVAVNDAGAIRYFGDRWTFDILGLNNAQLAFGGTLRFERVDWLVVFPGWFGESPMFDQFAVTQAFEIPLAEYTVCPCPSQTRSVIYQNKSAAAAHG